MSKKILVVDDERLIVDSIRYGLEKEGFAIVTASDGEQALAKARSEHPDLVVLDINLPKKDGWEVCRALRQESTLPIIMLTARGDEIDKVLGLELGADDYLVKPFSIRELTARVRAALRRSGYAQAEMQTIRVGFIELDAGAHRVTRDGIVVELSRREFDLLYALMQRVGKTIPRQQLIDLVWAEAWVGDPRTLDVHIRWLREKIEQDPSAPRYIQTVRGVGYRFANVEELDE